MSSGSGGQRFHRCVPTMAVAISALSLVLVASVPGLPGCGSGATSWQTEMRTAAEAGDWKKVAESARRQLRETPQDRESLRLLARASMHLDRADVAQGIYDRLGDDGMESEDRALVAETLIQVGEGDSALRILEEGLGKGEEHPQAMSLRARLWASSDRLAEAKPLAEKTASNPKWAARGWLLLAQIAEAQSEPEQAAAAYTKMLEAGASEWTLNRSDLQKRLARAWLRAGRADLAHRVLAEDSEADPEQKWLLSRVLLQLGDVSAASQIVEGNTFAAKPVDFEPAPYAGAAVCAGCHEDITRVQQASHHAQTFQTRAGLQSLPKPEGRVTDPNNPAISYQVEDSMKGLLLTSFRQDRQSQLQAEFGFGSGDRGATPVGRDSSGQFREFRLSYYHDAGGWDVTTGHLRNPECQEGGSACFLGRTLNNDGVRRCLDCHTTNPRAALEQRGPAALDHGIGCERCHGPAGNHTLAMNAYPAFPDVAISRPRLASNTQTLELCASCHSPRGAEVRRDDPASIRFQATTLTWSQCATRSQGALSCLSCHDPHRDAVTDPGYYTQKCLACHSPSNVAIPTSPAGDRARVIQLAADVVRTPCPVSPLENCVSCHMPTRTNVLPHTKFTDHFIRVHPSESVAKPKAE